VIIPATFTAAILCSILSMICWGSWANTLKLSGKWRFELFYYDYAFGVLLAAMIAAMTFGSMGDELSVYDNLLITGKMKLLQGAMGGVVFNLANMLLVGAIAIAGMSVAFPIAIGLALVIGVIWSYILNSQANPALLFGGVALVLGAIAVSAMAYSKYERAKRSAAARRISVKGIVISLASGILMGSFYPLVEMSKQGDNGLGPYTVACVFALGIFLSTFFFNLYFLNLPVDGPPIGMFEYFGGTAKQHLLGVLGGVIWCAGAVANFVAASAPRTVQVGPAVSYAIGQGATLVSALWGLFLWKEFAGAKPEVRRLVGLMLALFLAGLILVSIAPLYA